MLYDSMVSSARQCFSQQYFVFFREKPPHIVAKFPFWRHIKQITDLIHPDDFYKLTLRSGEYERMNNQITYMMFGLYLLLTLGVGVYFYDRKAKLEDYLLGGRAMGSWVTALSAQASDMSGWLLLGLPGAVFLFGIGQAWIAVGLLAGTILNWVLVAPRLRIYSAQLGALTISSFISLRFRDPLHLLRSLSALVTIFFFTIYAASGLVGAGKLFESMFGINYTLAVVIGLLVIVIYTASGGFLAVCWTDLFQGLLMFGALVILPLAVILRMDDGAIMQAAAEKEISMDLLPTLAGVSAGEAWYNSPEALKTLALATSLAWGLGYFGQPHILTRFMGIKSVKLLPRTITIAVIWVICSLAGAVLVGLAAIPLFDTLPAGDHEKVFIYLIQRFFSPYIGGVLLAAIMAAIMSTIDSQLLVSSSTLTEDCYGHFIRPRAGTGERVLVSRLCVILIAGAAGVLALIPGSSIFELVTFAWGGFGAAFGPVVLAGLFSKRTTWVSAVAGMVAGITALLLWHWFRFNLYLYEIVPGFLANFAVMWIVNIFHPQKDQRVLSEFRVMKRELHHGGEYRNSDEAASRG